VLGQIQALPVLAHPLSKRDASDDFLFMGTTREEMPANSLNCDLLYHILYPFWHYGNSTALVKSWSGSKKPILIHLILEKVKNLRL
jgi:hypothetical protein